MKLWKLYFFKQILQSFFFFLLCSFSIYCLIEYAASLGTFSKNSTFADTVLYYINTFLKRAEFIVPMAMLLSSVYSLTSIYASNEWTVLQLAGLSSYTLLSPFLLLSFICSFFLWTSSEFLLPSASKQLDHKKRPTSHSEVGKQDHIHVTSLQDGSKLIYQNYLVQEQKLFDVIWVKSMQEIWRMKYLSSDPFNPIAYYADHIVRNAEGLLEKKASYPSIILKELKWDLDMAYTHLLQPNYQPLSRLYKLIQDTHITHYEKGRLKSHFFFKLIIPLLSPLATIAVAPACLVFSRHRSLFSVYALYLFALFALYMLLDALAIVSSHSLVSPSVALVTPFMILGSFAIHRLRNHFT